MRAPHNQFTCDDILLPLGVSAYCMVRSSLKYSPKLTQKQLDEEIIIDAWKRGYAQNEVDE